MIWQLGLHQSIFNILEIAYHCCYNIVVNDLLDTLRSNSESWLPIMFELGLGVVIVLFRSRLS